MGCLLPVTLVRSQDVGLSAPEMSEWLIRQSEIPLVSYSYEWSFSMLRDAALVTLRSLQTALAHGFVLKDASSFNIVFEGTVPRLVDVHSIEPRKQGASWAGYAQFCRAFLFPLFLASHRGIDPSPLLISGLGEIGVDVAAALLRWRDKVRPGVFTNVSVQAGLERRFGGTAEEVGAAGASIHYPLAATQKQVARLERIVERLPRPSDDAWAGYSETHTYDAADVEAKDDFINRGIARVKPSTVLDLGSNVGRHTRIARSSGALTIAVDVSAACIDSIYRTSNGDSGLFPLVADVTKPSPAIGWRLTERRGLLDRLHADFGLALALVHHLRISSGIPLVEVVRFLTTLTTNGIVEWVDREDRMVQRLLALRPDVYADFTEAQFESTLASYARIEARQVLAGGTRTLYLWSAAPQSPTVASISR